NRENIRTRTPLGRRKREWRKIACRHPLSCGIALLAKLRHGDVIHDHQDIDVGMSRSVLASGGRAVDGDSAKGIAVNLAEAVDEVGERWGHLRHGLRVTGEGLRVRGCGWYSPPAARSSAGESA